MKKGLAVTLILLMMLSLCACQGKEAIQQLDLPTPPQATQSAAEQPAESTAAPIQTAPAAPAEESETHRVLVSIKTTSLEQYDPQAGNQLILSFSYETPVVYIEGRDQAAAAINEYLAMVDETYYTGDVNQGTGFNAMLERAEDNYAYVVGTGAEGIPLEFSCTRSARIERIDDSVINVRLESYEYTGGPHGSYEDRAYVFDAETGERLRLDALSSNYEALSAALVERMVAMANSDPYYAERIPDSFVAPADYAEAFKALLRDGSWYFNRQGLVLFSDVEELGPYAAGITEFSIPYEALKGLIDDRWLPKARQGTGSFTVAPMNQVENGTVEILDKLTVMDQGEELCLKAEGCVYDVILSTVYYTDSFQEQRQLWACSEMDDCALQLITVVPEGLPNLMVRFTDGEGNRQALLLSEDGRNGKPVLVDDSIQAVG